jgi:predicted nucleic acid-binding Zn finger protein
MSKNKEVTPEDKTSKIISSGGVKRHLFNPSGLELWTVVGSEGEYIQFPDRGVCSCPQSFFKRIRGEAEMCYHALAVKMARSNNEYVTVECSDDEIHILLGLLLV